MKSRPKTSRSSYRGVLFGSLVSLLFSGVLSPRAQAVIPVFIDGDLSFYANALPQWVQVEGQLTEMTMILNSIYQRQGSSLALLNQVVPQVSSVTQPLDAIKAMESCAQTVSTGMSARLPSSAASTITAGAGVSARMHVLGDSVQRSDERYRVYAVQDALRERHARALEQQDKVLENEIAEQKKLLESLRSATTQMEVATIQAAMNASQQRVECARMKCDQARDEALAGKAQVAVERQRKQEADAELGQTLSRRLQERALTALSSQASDSL